MSNATPPPSRLGSGSERTRHIAPTARERRGQALVEFALVAPVLLLILLAVVQLGFLFGAQIGLINAVREAARYGSLSPTTTSSTAAANGAAIESYLRTTLLPRSVPTYRAASVEQIAIAYCAYQNPGGGSYSVRLTVSVTYAHPLFVPLVAAILDPFDDRPGAFVLSTAERFRVENPPLNTSDVSTLPTCS